MEQAFTRTQRLLGSRAMARLAAARVAVFGIGGVGGYVCEALCRSGVGSLDLVDDDCVCESNLNRQIIATRPALGRPKAEVMRERILSINPQAQVRVRRCFLLPETAAQFPFAAYDYVVDAVDTVAAKLVLAEQCRQCGTPLISCMGMGNRLDPTALRVGDIFATRGDPLARVMRRELKRRGIDALRVVYSEEPPRRPLPAADGLGAAGGAGEDLDPDTRPPAGRRDTPGSAPFVPAAAGLVLAAEVVKALAGEGLLLPEGG